jgi:RNA polymerase sigma-70 factor (ECF subfamily)
MVPLQLVAEPADELPHDVAVDSDELQLVLNELPEEFRTPLILFYFDEFTYREIAEQMNVPIGTVMSRLARAKSYLRRRLETMQSAPAR